MPIIKYTGTYRNSEEIETKGSTEGIMAYIQRGNIFRQITGNLIVYSISVFLGGIALVFFYNSWNSTAGHLIIFMSPYLLYIAVSYGLRQKKRKLTMEKSGKEEFHTNAQRIQRKETSIYEKRLTK